MGRATRDAAVALNASGWTAMAAANTRRSKLLIQNLEAAAGINILLRCSDTDPGAGATTGFILHPEATLVDSPDACLTAVWGRSASGTPSVWVREEEP